MRFAKSFALVALLRLGLAAKVIGHPRCRDSVDGLISMAVKAESPLERHAHTSSHGDVCRNAETKGYFCPKGCEHAETVPYCMEVICGIVTPCRVAPDQDTAKGLLTKVRGTNAVAESSSVGHDVKNVGQNCYPACHRTMSVDESSCCPDFCGSAGACCKLNDPESRNSEACFYGRIGCPHGHCCVAAHHD